MPVEGKAVVRSRRRVAASGSKRHDMKDLSVAWDLYHSYVTDVSILCHKGVKDMLS